MRCYLFNWPELISNLHWIFLHLDVVLSQSASIAESEGSEVRGRWSSSSKEPNKILLMAQLTNNVWLRPEATAECAPLAIRKRAHFFLAPCSTIWPCSLSAKLYVRKTAAGKPQVLTDCLLIQPEPRTSGSSRKRAGHQRFRHLHLQSHSRRLPKLTDDQTTKMQSSCRQVKAREVDGLRKAADRTDASFIELPRVIIDPRRSSANRVKAAYGTPAEVLA